jgi:hypothetical protein
MLKVIEKPEPREASGEDLLLDEIARADAQRLLMPRSRQRPTIMSSAISRGA